MTFQAKFAEWLYVSRGSDMSLATLDIALKLGPAVMIFLVWCQEDDDST